MLGASRVSGSGHTTSRVCRGLERALAHLALVGARLGLQVVQQHAQHVRNRAAHRAGRRLVHALRAPPLERLPPPRRRQRRRLLRTHPAPIAFFFVPWTRPYPITHPKSVSIPRTQDPPCSLDIPGTGPIPGFFREKGWYVPAGHVWSVAPTAAGVALSLIRSVSFPRWIHNQPSGLLLPSVCRGSSHSRRVCSPCCTFASKTYMIPGREFRAAILDSYAWQHLSTSARTKTPEVQDRGPETGHPRQEVWTHPTMPGA